MCDPSLYQNMSIIWINIENCVRSCLYVAIMRNGIMGIFMNFWLCYRKYNEYSISDMIAVNYSEIPFVQLITLIQQCKNILLDFPDSTQVDILKMKQYPVLGCVCLWPVNRSSSTTNKYKWFVG